MASSSRSSSRRGDARFRRLAVIAVGVVLMGKLFGVAGLFVAIPVISLAIILVQELWVLPRERAAAGGGALPVARTEQRPVASSR